MEEDLKVIHPKSAGIDIGSTEYYVDAGVGEIKVFPTYTSDCQALVDYLKMHQIETVVMESTGVYWVSLYSMLEQNGIETWVVNGREAKNVPGRKSDVKDCQWLRRLHSYGLLRKSFIVDESFRPLRDINRLRQDHIRSKASQVHLMQKALIQMNIRLSEAIDDIMGTSGREIIEAILGGERNAQKLLSLCHSSIKNKKSEKVLKALNGVYSKEHMFTLGQAYKSYVHYENLIAECDAELAKELERISSEKIKEEEYETDKQKKKRKPIRYHRPNIEKLDEQLLTITQGRDPINIPGITDYSFMQIVSEIGSDLSHWKNSKHFTSWMDLAPRNNQSGGKRRKVKGRGSNKAGQIFRVIAQGLINSKHNALGAFGRRIRARKGTGVAIKALARKIATYYYLVMQEGMDFVNNGIKEYEERLKAQQIKFIKKMADALDLELVERETGCCP